VATSGHANQAEGKVLFVTSVESPGIEVPSNVASNENRTQLMKTCVLLDDLDGNNDTSFIFMTSADTAFTKQSHTILLDLTL
jgi:hypothetical protein